MFNNFFNLTHYNIYIRARFHDSESQPPFKKKLKSKTILDIYNPFYHSVSQHFNWLFSPKQFQISVSITLFQLFLLIGKNFY